MYKRQRESSGIKRHDAHPHAEGSSAEADSKPGIAGKIKASIADVSHATQDAGWGAPKTSAGRVDVETKESAPSVEGATPLVEAGVDVGAAPSVSASVSAPSADVDADVVPGAGGGLTLPSGSMGVGGECGDPRYVCICVVPVFLQAGGVGVTVAIVVFVVFVFVVFVVVVARCFCGLLAQG